MARGATMKSFICRPKILSGFILCVIMAAGCTEERPDPAFPLVTVQGRIQRNGQPLSSGWVEFVPVDGGQGVMKSGPIESNGQYKATGLGPGLHGVRVIVPRDKSLFPFDQFFSPIRRTLSAEPVQTFDIDLSAESAKPK